MINKNAAFKQFKTSFFFGFKISKESRVTNSIGIIRPRINYNRDENRYEERFPMIAVRRKLLTNMFILQLKVPY